MPPTIPWWVLVPFWGCALRCEATAFGASEGKRSALQDKPGPLADLYSKVATLEAANVKDQAFVTHKMEVLAAKIEELAAKMEGKAVNSNDQSGDMDMPTLITEAALVTSAPISAETEVASPGDDMPNANLYGFFFQTYQNPKCTVGIVKQVREHFADAPIFLLSDLGGYDYQAVCDKYPPCHFELAKRKFGKVTGSFLEKDADKEENVGRVHEDLRIWFERVARATKFVDSKYVIILEDDVTIANSPEKEPPHDAGGIDLGRSIDFKTVDGVKTAVVTEGWDPYSQTYLGNKPSCNWSPALLADRAKLWSYPGWGMAGGSYFKSSVMTSIMSDPDWWSRATELEKLDGRVSVFDDATIAALIMDYGYTLKPWDEVHFQYGSEAEGIFDQNLCKEMHTSGPCIFTTSAKQCYGQELTAGDGFRLDGDKVVTA